MHRSSEWCISPGLSRNFRHKRMSEHMKDPKIIPLIEAEAIAVDNKTPNLETSSEYQRKSKYI